MCGFSGYISFDGSQNLSADAVIRMNRSIAHRGPDGEGYFFFGPQKENSTGHFKVAPIHGALAHRRLSIIDLSDKANQPMHSQDNSVSVIFNGEIYNHKEIREELEKAGCKFVTDHSDTEVLIQAYKKFGIEAIHKFRGMFAIVLIDFEKEKIFFVRDRIGVKPLYYSWHGKRLIFASEIKAIIRATGSVPALRHQSVYDYMTFLTVPAPHTMYEGIMKLPAGHLMEISFKGNTHIREYWNPLDEVRKETSQTSDEWQKTILSRLKTSVRYRMESDVPVGVFLSGGIDSSANAVLFSELSHKERMKTFTVGYSGSITHSNEFPYAKQVADSINSIHFERRIEQRELIEFLPKMVFHQDEPIADPVCIPLYFIAKLARENGVTVCQVGEGSDELFIGYTDWITKYKLQKFGNFPIPRFLKSAFYSLLEAAGLSTATAREFLRRNASGLPVFWSGAEAFTEAEKIKLFRKEYRAMHSLKSPDEYIKSLHKEFLAKAKVPSICNWMTYADLKLRLPELLLMRVDKMTMACGLEARVPFLDHEFVQMAFQIPEDIKIADSECKSVLKKSVEPILPHEIIYRKKQGFSVPVTEWLSELLGNEVEKTIRDFQAETNMFDPQGLDHFIKTKHRGVWNLYNLALWWKNRRLEELK